MVRLDEQRNLAARVAATADLNEVRLFNVDATLDQLPSGPGGLNYDFDADVEVQHVGETNALIVTGKYELVVHFVHHEAQPRDQEGGELVDSEANASLDQDDMHEHLAHLNFQLAALYSLPTDEDPIEFSEDELHAFGQTTGLLTLHPYAREFVSDMTGRMGLPSLHLGTVRFHIDKLDEPGM
jgi:hypothetical protein